MRGFIGPVIPCDSSLCSFPACRILQWSGEHIANLCTEHEWTMMRTLYKAVRKHDLIEAEGGWQKFCRERGYSHLETTWLGAMTSWRPPVESDPVHVPEV